MIEALAQPVELPLWLVLTLAGYQRALALAGDARERHRQRKEAADEKQRQHGGR